MATNKGKQKPGQVPAPHRIPSLVQETGKLSARPATSHTVCPPGAGQGNTRAGRAQRSAGLVPGHRDEVSHVRFWLPSA